MGRENWGWEGWKHQSQGPGGREEELAGGRGELLLVCLGWTSLLRLPITAE